MEAKSEQVDLGILEEWSRQKQTNKDDLKILRITPAVVLILGIGL